MTLVRVSTSIGKLAFDRGIFYDLRLLFGKHVRVIWSNGT